MLRKAEEIKRLMFGEDWIDLRSERKYNDTLEAQRAAASRVSSPGKKGAGEIRFDYAQFNLALLESMIVAWSDTDAAGTMIPITADAIKELPSDIVQTVLNEILGDDLEEDEENPLGKNSTSVSESQEVSSLPETKAEHLGQES